MKNQLTVAEKPGEADGLRLLWLWDVDEDAAYDVDRGAGRHDEPHVCIRTIAGQGRLAGRRGRFELRAGTVLLIPGDEILHYATLGRTWRFYWAVVDGHVPLPTGVVLTAPERPFEVGVWQEIPRLLQGSVRAGAAASGLFAALVRNWLAEAAVAGQSGGPHLDRVQGAVTSMHQCLEAGLSVADLAAEARMSERNFRRIFRNSTGLSPKKFFDRLRLNLAREILLNGQCTVAETAFRLGFSSPFHFSASYRRHFGAPPKFSCRAAMPALPVAGNRDG